MFTSTVQTDVFLNRDGCRLDAMKRAAEIICIQLAGLVDIALPCEIETMRVVFRMVKSKCACAVRKGVSREVEARVWLLGRVEARIVEALGR